MWRWIKNVLAMPVRVAEILADHDAFARSLGEIMATEQDGLDAIAALETKVDNLTQLAVDTKTAIDVIKGMSNVPQAVMDKLTELGAKVDAATVAETDAKTDAAG